MNNELDQSYDDEQLLRIFTSPEGNGSALNKLEVDISANLMGFLNDNIAAVEKPLEQIEQDFQHFQVPEQAVSVSEYVAQLMDSTIAYSVHTAAPSFIGHMTSSLPNFLLAFSKLMVGLNQNVVKIETSKAFTPLERQVLGMMHHLVYGQTESFYQQWMHSASDSLGAFCSGGTVANISALWIARNHLLAADGDFKGIASSGLMAAMRHYGYQDIAVLVSERGHYSLGKAADVLGIGRENFIAIPTDEHNRVNVEAMAETARNLQQQGIRVMAIVGVAGTTETGNIDPLDQLADLAAELACHFHVDAAWGGATLFSDTHRELLRGIERADSVTIDAHKQMYLPMGAGLVVFKDPQLANGIEHHAEYILRKGSKDLGRHTLEGSRPGMAMLVQACFNIIGRQGYARLIDISISKARYFADLITTAADFELITEPELCLLTYRYVPAQLQRRLQQVGDAAQYEEICVALDNLTATIQKRQREQGLSFVSRTRLTPVRYQRRPTVVFRVVLANPLTKQSVLKQVLVEQRQLALSDQDFQAFLQQLDYLN